MNKRSIKSVPEATGVLKVILAAYPSVEDMKVVSL